MTNSSKIVAAVIVLLAVPASLRAQTNSQSESRISPLTRPAITAPDAAQSQPAANPAAHTGNPDSANYVSRGPFRTWYLFPLCIYVLPVVIFAVIFSFKHRRIRLMHDTLRAMIEKGQPVTPEVIAALKPQDGRGHQMCYLLPGLILSAVGIGMMINGGRAGLIPLLIGVAFLIAWQVEKRSAKTDQPPRQ